MYTQQLSTIEFLTSVVVQRGRIAGGDPGILQKGGGEGPRKCRNFQTDKQDKPVRAGGVGSSNSSRGRGSGSSKRQVRKNVPWCVHGVYGQGG